MLDIHCLSYILYCLFLGRETKMFTKDDQEKIQSSIYKRNSLSIQNNQLKMFSPWEFSRWDFDVTEEILTVDDNHLYDITFSSIEVKLRV